MRLNLSSTNSDNENGILSSTSLSQLVHPVCDSSFVLGNRRGVRQPYVRVLKVVW